MKRVALTLVLVLMLLAFVLLLLKDEDPAPPMYVESALEDEPPPAVPASRRVDSSGPPSWDLNEACYARSRLFGEANVIEPLHARQAFLRMQSDGFRSRRDLYVRSMPTLSASPKHVPQNDSPAARAIMQAPPLHRAHDMAAGEALLGSGASP